MFCFTLENQYPEVRRLREVGTKMGPNIDQKWGTPSARGSRAVLGVSCERLGSRPGRRLGGLGVILGRLGAVLGASWGVLERLGTGWRACWGRLGATWAAWKASWSVLEVSWRLLGGSWVRFRGVTMRFWNVFNARTGSR